MLSSSSPIFFFMVGGSSPRLTTVFIVIVWQLSHLICNGYCIIPGFRVVPLSSSFFTTTPPSASSFSFSKSSSTCRNTIPRRRSRTYRRSWTYVESTSHDYQRFNLTDDKCLQDVVLTSFLLQISYDGSRFTGWSAANTMEEHTTRGNELLLNTEAFTSMNNTEQEIRRQGRSSRRRRKAVVFPPAATTTTTKKGFVRSVEGLLRKNLAQLYGKVSPERIVVEGCSRTDKGVHAKCMIAQVYCLREGVIEMIATAQNNNKTTDGLMEPSIPGKRLPHPRNATDTSYFTPVKLSMTRLTMSLNRMCEDAQVMAYATIPPQGTSKPYPFHPTLSATTKTYRYYISTGPWHDPTVWRRVWHVGDQLDLLAMKSACDLLQGTRNFSAFQGVPRGRDDKIKQLNQSTICTMERIEIETVSIWLNTTTYTISVTGDRFLYKMVRFLVGTLVNVGKGKIDLSTLEDVIMTGDGCSITRQCAPAYGLVLHSVQFDEEIEWQPASC